MEGCISCYNIVQGKVPNRLDDCVLIKLAVGHQVLLPPGYGHVLINSSRGSGLVAGLYYRAATPEYEAFRMLRGAAYHLIQRNGELEVSMNERYTSAPPLRRLENVTGTVFELPFGDSPLWSTFVARPERYAALSDPNALQRAFGLRVEP